MNAHTGRKKGVMIVVGVWRSSLSLDARQQKLGGNESDSEEFLRHPRTPARYAPTYPRIYEAESEMIRARDEVIE